MPGFSTTLTKRALDLFQKFGNNMIREYLSSSKHYNFNGKTSGVSLKLDDAVVQSFDPDFDLKVRYKEPDGIAIDVANLSFRLYSTYLITMWGGMFWNHGKVTSDIEGISGNVLFDPVVEGGKVKPDVIQCELQLRKLNLEFHGGLVNQIMNLFRDSLASRVRNYVKEHFCSYLKEKLIPSVQESFLLVEDCTPIFDNFYLNHSIIGNPLIRSDFLHMAHNGQIFARVNETGEQFDKESPFQREPLPFDPTTNRTVRLQLSPYIVSTLMFFIYKYNKIDMDFTPENTPDEFAHYFQTTCTDLCAGTLFPQLEVFHPNGTMAVIFKIHEPPVVTLEKGHIKLTAVLNLTGFVVNQDGEASEDIFSGLSKIQLRMLNFKFINSSLKMDIAVDKFGLTDFNSIYKDIDRESFDFVLGFASDDFLQPRLSYLIGRGITIPKAGPFVLKEGDVLIDEDVMNLSADFNVEF